MSRRKLTSITPSTSNKTCCFCGLSEDNELEFGKFYEHDGIVTHYYCLLLSSNTEQKGNDNEGILGFLAEDIKKELRRGKRLVCSYCKRSGATLGCCNTKCKRIFHFPCGLRAGSLHQFFGEFRSYCINHRPKQKVNNLNEEIDTLDGALCYICYDEVNLNDIIETLCAPCCRKNALFHRKCVQQLAMSAGYFFKCPLCNNKKKFRNAMLECGIFIPSQDASWELEPNAFQELLHRHDRCDSRTCLCPKGRTHVSSNAKWELILCRLCGSQGTHMACSHLKWINPVWECPECVGILKKSTETTVPTKSKESRTKLSRIMNNVQKESDCENSDSDISVGSNSPLLEESASQSLSLFPFMRPGPRSFKLQQAEKVVMGLQESNKSGHSSEETRCSSATTHSSRNDNNVDNLSVKEGCSETTKGLDVSNAVKFSENVIVIDSDDDVEIVNEKPKQNILTTNYGTQIEIHNLSESMGGPYHIEGDVKVTKPVSPVTPVIRSMQSAVQNACKFNPTHSQSERPQCSTLKTNDGNNDDSIMNIKITNVTSLPPEVFASAPQDARILQNNEISSKKLTMEMLNNAIESHITSLLQQDTARPIEVNVKRKSNINHTMDKNVVDLTNVQIIEKSKRLRTSDPGPSSFTSDNINYNINTSRAQTGQSVPIIVTELSQTAPTAVDNRTRNPVNLEKNNASAKTIRTECSQENLLYQHLTSSPKSSDYQSSKNLNTTGNIQYTGVQQTSNGVTSRYSLPNPSNVSDYYSTLSSQNDDRLYVRLSNNGVIDQGRLINQQTYVPETSVNVSDQNRSEKSDNIYVIDQNISNNEPTSKTNNRCIAASQLTLRNTFVNTIANNYIITPSNNKGLSNDKNKMSEVADTTLEQNRTDRFTSGCDGDAGTDPAIESGDDSSSAVRRVTEAAEPAALYRINAASSKRPRRSRDRQTSAIDWAVSNARCSSGFSPARGSCDRSRMIPENVCLRDLKFRVCGSDTIQMILYNTFIVNIKMNSANKQNIDGNVQGKKFIPNQKSVSQDHDQDQCSLSSESCSSIENDFNDIADDFSDKLERDLPPNNEDYVKLKRNSFDANSDDVHERIEGIEEKNVDRDSRYKFRNRYETYAQDDLKENLDPVVSTSLSNAFETFDVLDKQNKIVPSNNNSDIDHTSETLNDVTSDSLNQSAYRTNEQSSESKMIFSESCSYNLEGDSVECVHGSSQIIGEDSTIDPHDSFKRVTNLDRKCELDVKHLDKNIGNSILQESKDYNITTDSRVVALKSKAEDVNFCSYISKNIGTNESDNSVENVNINKSMVERLSMNSAPDNAFKLHAICDNMLSDVHNMEKAFIDAMSSDEVKPCTENKYKGKVKIRECIKVSIDLKRVRNLMDSKPELFSKKRKNTAKKVNRNFRRKYQFDNKRLLVKSQSLDSLYYGSAKDKVAASFPNRTCRSMQNLCRDIAGITDDSKCDLKIVRQNLLQNYEQCEKNVDPMNVQSSNKDNSIHIKGSRKRKRKNV